MDLDIKNFFNCLFDDLDPWVAKFNDFAGIGHYNMVVLLIEVRFFIVRLVLSKLMLSDKRAIKQKFNRIVKCSSANAVVLVLHLDIEVFNIKMLFAVINLLKNGVALRGFSMALVFQVFGKDILYDFLVFAVINGY